MAPKVLGGRAFFPVGANGWSFFMYKPRRGKRRQGNWGRCFFAIEEECLQPFWLSLHLVWQEQQLLTLLSPLKLWYLFLKMTPDFTQMTKFLLSRVKTAASYDLWVKSQSSWLVTWAQWQENIPGSRSEGSKLWPVGWIWSLPGMSSSLCSTGDIMNNLNYSTQGLLQLAASGVCQTSKLGAWCPMHGWLVTTMPGNCSWGRLWQNTKCHSCWGWFSFPQWSPVWR